MELDLTWSEAMDVVYDPAGQALYAVEDAMPYPVELDSGGHTITVQAFPSTFRSK